MPNNTVIVQTLQCTKGVERVPAGTYPNFVLLTHTPIYPSVEVCVRHLFIFSTPEDESECMHVKTTVNRQRKFPLRIFFNCFKQMGGIFS